MQILIEEVRFSRVYVFQKGKAFDEGGKEKYSIHGIVDRDSPVVQQVKDAIVAAAKEAWGEKWEAKLKAISANGKQWVLRDGDTKADNPAYAGKMFIAAKNETRPTVVDGQRAPLTADDGKPYPGSYGAMIIDIKASDLPTPQIFAYLCGVQFIRDGERLGGGGVAPASAFRAVPPTAKAQAAKTGEGAKALF